MCVTCFYIVIVLFNLFYYYSNLYMQSCFLLSIVFFVFMCSFLLYVVFFFFKQKTAYEMRISDWSSDVCSSDLADFWPLRRMSGGQHETRVRGLMRWPG